MNPLSLYVHIPFCEVKCGYCDFFSLPRGHEDFDLQKEYTSALIREIETRSAGTPSKIQTIFFGGGTPSLLDPRLLEKIMVVLAKRFDWSDEIEITLEANPKTVTRERLAAFRSLGVNRLSVGVQSFQDKYLKFLGRIHLGDEARRTIGEAFEAGFRNVNLDLIYGLPDQTLTELGHDLETALSLGTTHLAAYQLTIEAGTPFSALHRRGELTMLPDDRLGEMFEIVRDRLQGAGLAAYEISNFARPGLECRHNLNYWDYGEWFGFGAGAVSFTYPRRRQNVRDLKKYLAGQWEQETEGISPSTAMGEFLMVGLRKRDGISTATFERKFGKGLTEAYPVIHTLQRDGWLEAGAGAVKLSARGIPVANSILEKFL